MQPTNPERRDPRTNPKRGDVFLKGKRKRTVTDRGSFYRPDVDGVHFIIPSHRDQQFAWERLDCFQRWAKNAEVIDRAD